jgi:hypothetical protein
MNLTIGLAFVAGVLAVLQFSHIGPRVSPSVLIVVALLLSARYAVQRQKQKRAQLLKEVPRRPLGLDEE